MCGSTNTGSVDETGELADLAEREDLWLHVDAAYGGAARLSARAAPLVPDLERAHSVTVDPHKWFFQAYDIGGLVVRDREDLVRTFHTAPEYYRSTRPEDEPLNWYQYSIEGTRRFRALKLWFSWKHLGTEGFGRLIEHNLDLAAHMTRRIAESDDFMAMPETPDLSIVCFRHVPGGRDREPSLDAAALDAYQDRLQRALEVSGRGWVSTTTLRGQDVPARRPGEPPLDDDDVDRVLDTLRESSADAAARGGPAGGRVSVARHRVASEGCRTPSSSSEDVVSSAVPAGGRAGCRWQPWCGSVSPRWARSSRRHPTRRTRRRLPPGRGRSGFDISYPQCAWQRLPPGKFGIVGMNRGRPFTLNPCVGRLYAWAARRGTPSLYVNVAFHPSYADHVTSWCHANVPADLTKPRPRLAWAVGCSEAAYSLANAPGPARLVVAGRRDGEQLGRPQGQPDDDHGRGRVPAPVRGDAGGRVLDRALVVARDRVRPVESAGGDGQLARAWTANRTVKTAAQDCGSGFSGMPVTLVQFYRHGRIGTWDANWAC